MNVSYEWLRAFVPFDQSPRELRDLLTAHTVTVDELVPLRQDLAAFVVARVVTEAAHPDSDHLHVTKVDMGTGTLLDVVCGAPNVTAGKLYPFAPTGTAMPSGLKIVKRKIRGETSDGMLCSARELGLGDEQDGILELDIDVPPGTPLLRALTLGDMQLVLDVGANRPDLLSHLGVARELAALTGKPMALPAIDGLGAQAPAAVAAEREGKAADVAVRLEAPALARRYMGVVIRGVRVGPSPEWLVKRLQSVGARSINNVVDASNYILHELGQPTHAFDLAKLAGGAVIVREARAGERIVTLDGVDRTLSGGTPVIADAQRAQAIAGVMGGRDSEVTDATTDLFLEVANFSPAHTRAARRALGMSTDASYRFERGVDVALCAAALDRTARLIVAVAGGSIAGAPVDLGSARELRPAIALRPARVQRLLGEPIDAQESANLLSRVGFEIAKADGDLRVTAPSWREDVSAEVDLIEEVARLRGYDSFSVELRPFAPSAVPDDPFWLVAGAVRERLVSAGLLEVKPMPFVAGGEGEGLARLTNPLAENEAYLRRDILTTLARRAEFNLARMQGDIRLFEIGSVFERRAGALPREELRVAALVMGRREPRHFTDPKSTDFDGWATVDEWDAKALAEALVGTLGASASHAQLARETQPAGAFSLAPGGTDGVLWHIRRDGSDVGAVRRIALDAPVWAKPAFGIELSLGEVSSAPVDPAKRGDTARSVPAAHRRYAPVPSTPPAEFDLALLVPDGVQAAQVESVMQRVAGDILERVELFDRYEGPGVKAAHRSLAWRLTLRHAERTLREKEIEARRAKIVDALAAELNVIQRSS